jgi:hypothetical protein
MEAGTRSRIFDGQVASYGLVLQPGVDT